MDPEQIYAEVLSEEQQKGSAPAVAEGRAKAARARAEAGSPTPKEAKWWPGSQPQFEGGGAAPAVEEEAPAPEAEEAPAAEAPPAEAPAAESAAAEPAVAEPAAPAPVAEPAPAAAEQPAAASATQPLPAPTPTDATAPVPVAAAAAPTPAHAEAAPAAAAPLPSGVSAGTTTGTRLRPEDESATDAQFAGQQAMYERRKLIDELVATGVPVVTASSSGRSRGGAGLALLYLLIPIAAIAILAGVNKGGASPSGSSTPAASGPSITAQNVQFTTSTLSFPADKPVTLHFDNKDSTAHNVAIYDKKGGKELFKGNVITGPTTTDYKVNPLKAGTYYFQCDVHPDSMNGTLTVK